MIRIRPGTEADLPAVFELNRRLLPEAWSKKSILHALASGHELIVAEREERIVAYLLSHDVLDEVHLLQIAVHPDFQRQGLATRLSRFLFARKAGLSMVYLEVRASNAPAQQLYAALGFRIAGCRREYYPPPPGQTRREDAILMTRLLEPAQEPHGNL
ncbi:MAG TPA: ribosomal protein S18-alanine N-acetyltransferase [Mariprofundaceae bacterium]|nr:ribosomal protein S18-alanine N-acetyltransferase [Mariprofundaceae bacterium]